MPHIYWPIPMHIQQFLNLSSRENSFNSHIKIYRFCHFFKFSLKNVSRKVQISQRRKNVATNFGRFLGFSEHFHYPLTSSFFPYFKTSCQGFRKIALNPIALLMTSLCHNYVIIYDVILESNTSFDSLNLIVQRHTY